MMNSRLRKAPPVFVLLFLLFANIPTAFTAPKIHETQGDPCIQQSAPVDSKNFQIFGWFSDLFKSWTVSEDGKIACRKSPPSTEKSRADFIEHWAQASGVSPISKTINGVHFENESPELLRAFQDLTSAVDFFGKPNDPQPQTFSVNPGCQKVRCALNEIYAGQDKAERVLHLFARYGAAASPFREANASPLNPSELDAIEQAFSDLPPGFLPEKRVLPIHYDKRPNRGGGAAANAHIMLFEYWGKTDHEDQTRILTHEMGHRMADGDGQDLDSSAEWLEAAGWTLLPEVTRTTAPSVFTDFEIQGHDTVSSYARTNPAEDFAESVTAYRINPELLKKRSPKRYQFLKEAVFAGIEYTSEKACSQESSLLQQQKKIMADKIEKNPDLLLEGQKDAMKTCAAAMLEGWDPLVKGLKISLAARKCIEGQVIAASFASSLKEDASIKYQKQAVKALVRGSELSTIVSKDAYTKLSGNIEEAVRNQFKKMLKGTLISKSAFPLARYYMNEPIEKRCKHLTDYSYQEASRLYGAEWEVSEPALNVFLNREKIESFLQTTCVALLAKKPSAETPAADDINAYIDEKFRQ